MFFYFFFIDLHLKLFAKSIIIRQLSTLDSHCPLLSMIQWPLSFFEYSMAIPLSYCKKCCCSENFALLDFHRQTIAHTRSRIFLTLKICSALPKVTWFCLLFSAMKLNFSHKFFSRFVPLGPKITKLFACLHEWPSSLLTCSTLQWFFFIGFIPIAWS